MLAAKGQCSICGASISNDSPVGLCGPCALHQAFNANPAKDGSVQPGVTLLLTDTGEVSSQIGRYKIIRPIGEGGCGIVYFAVQEEPMQRHVALKIIKPGMDSQQVLARFEAERQALAMMDHPNIAKVLDAGATPSGRPYFVMELVKGISITEYCDQAKLTTNDRLELFLPVCHAIQHAHQKGIIHRDIKPSNMLVTLQDGVAVPKVIDFGIAKATTGQPLTDKTIFTAFEQFIGTPAYMSPEQAELSGLDIDTRSDIYSLGVLLYELLTGKTPFDGKQLLSAGLDRMRRIIRDEEPLRPSTRVRSLEIEEQTAIAQRRQCDPPRLTAVIGGDLDWIVMKCLEKERSRRYATANGLAAEIQRYLKDEPVSARPPSRSYRLQKLIRRNRLSIATLGIFVAALMLCVVFSTWQAVRARNSERLQSKLREEAVAARHQEAVSRQQAEQAARQANELLNQFAALLEEDRSPRSRASILARFGRTHAAIAEFRTAIDMSPDDHWLWFQMSPLVAEVEGPEGYRKHVSMMLARFGQTADPYVADRIAKSSLLIPGACDDFESTAKLVDKAIALGEDHIWAPYFQFTKSLSEYRQGRFAGAVDWAAKALGQLGRIRERDVQAYMVRAMALHQLGRSAESRAAYGKGELIAREHMQMLVGGPNWHDVMLAELLMREAKGLIKDSELHKE